jgi:DNA repair protein RadD
MRGSFGPQTGIQHQIIAAACSVDHARQIASIYRECNYRAAEIHSDIDPDDQGAVTERLRQGQLDCIVQVQILGEGFDHPRLSNAAIFRPFRSLAPLHPVRRPSHASGPSYST